MNTALFNAAKKLSRDAELLVHFQQLGIDLVEALEAGLLLRRRVVVQLLVVDRLVLDPRPVRLLHLLPGGERLQPPLQQPVGLALAVGDQADGVFAEALGRDIHLDRGFPAPFVAGLGDGLDGVERFGDGRHKDPYSAGSAGAGWVGAGRVGTPAARLGTRKARGIAASCISASVIDDSAWWMAS